MRVQTSDFYRDQIGTHIFVRHLRRGHCFMPCRFLSYFPSSGSPCWFQVGGVTFFVQTSGAASPVSCLGAVFSVLRESARRLARSSRRCSESRPTHPETPVSVRPSLIASPRIWRVRVRISRMGWGWCECASQARRAAGGFARLACACFCANFPEAKRLVTNADLNFYYLSSTC